VAHVELSLSEPFVDPGRDTPPEGGGSLQRWARAVAEADEPCLVLEHASVVVESVIMAVSPAAARMLGFPDLDSAVGRRLFDVLQLVDFTSSPLALPGGDLEKIPPVLASSSGRLARGLLRVRTPDEVLTVDAIATPLFDAGRPVGSLTFFSQI
jgi:hypothetical protein